MGDPLIPGRTATDSAGRKVAANSDRAPPVTVLAALTMLGADQLADLTLHQLLRDHPHRLADHVCMLIAQPPA
jgi:hypothetical protein